MKNNHPDAYIICEQCQKQVKAHYLRKHVYMRHRKGEYKCSQDCEFVAEYYHELEKHRYMMHYNRYNWPEQGSNTSLGNNNNGNLMMSSSSSSSVATTSAISSNNNLNVNNNNSNNNNNSTDDTILARSKRFVCKWNDCSFSHENRSKVLKHIRINHFSGSQCITRNGFTSQQQQSSNSSQQPDERKVLEFLDVIEYNNNNNNKLDISFNFE